MSIHKLTAGSGYDYLTRQVAAMDATDKGHTGLASYYTERGETPGSWIGSGLVGIEGVAAGDVVTAEQMQNLFGSGHHPLATQRTGALPTSAPAEDLRTATRLGQPFKVYASDATAFQVEVARRLAETNQGAGLPGDWPVPTDERARVRTQVAVEFFRAEHGRDPDGAREVAATIARHTRPKTTAVAGYDLTFSPVKSVSTLWAVADQATAAQVELAHQAAVADALAFVEQRALFTRTGTNGVRQVDVAGIVATAFTHRDSRAGDPDLHTHVAVANKVQTGEGRWLSIDGRVLFKATVAASETYNTALEKHLGDRLGLRFAERAGDDPRKRPVREIVGVDEALNQRWSARRASIQARRAELAVAFQASHGRPPTPIESVQLAQQATLETRQAKHSPRTLAEQRAVWRAEAGQVLGGADSVDDMVLNALTAGTTGAAAPGPVVDARWVGKAAGEVLAAMEQRRATWQVWHVHAEAQRRVRGADVATADVERVVDLVVDEVLTTRSVSLARATHRTPHDNPHDNPHEGSGEDIQEPGALRRADGTSVYTVAGADLFTSTQVLAAEQRLVEAAGRRDGHAVTDADVDLALLESAANGVELNAGQATLVRQMATSGARVQLAIAPAGSGKTTAMRALATAWENACGRVIGLAPSAAAAAALRDQIGTRTDTLAKLTHDLSNDPGTARPAWLAEIGPHTLVLIDEAGMADTLSLDTAVQYALDRGASVRLVGDDQQLAAIGAGGVLRDIKAEHGATHLSELLRFADPAEGAATLALREGRTEALGYYLDSGRVHVGDTATNTDAVFDSWRADRSRGLDSIMLAPTRELVGELNQRARSHRLSTSAATPSAPTDPETPADPSVPPAPSVPLSDGHNASIGELVITRRNERRLRTTATDWVKNGDRWTVLDLHDDGGMTVQHARNARVVRLPGQYVGTAVELGYASTIHTAQGVSVDTMHGLATGQESRQLLYTMLTRGRLANHVHLEVVGDGDPHSVIHPDATHPRTPTQILEEILARDTAPTSATTLQRQHADPAQRLGHAAARYLDALYVAAEDVAGATVVDQLEQHAREVDQALVDQPAWPTLRAHLLLLAAAGDDPGQALRAAAARREVDTADDTAAVLDWRLDSTGLRNAGPGPLPWVPAIPARINQHPTWGPYLQQRAALVQDLAARVRDRALDPATTVPAWAQSLAHRPTADVVAEVQLWRAATAVAETDHRPTGPRQLQKTTATWQRRLDRAVAGGRTPARAEWAPLLDQVAPGARRDGFVTTLSERLAALSRAGLPAHQMLVQAATTGGALPDDHAAAALWWRISRRLTPDVAAVVDDPHPPVSAWAPTLAAVVGADRAERIQASPYWPALVATVDHGLARGWAADQLLEAAAPAHDLDDADQCQAMVWRASILTDPSPTAGVHSFDLPTDASDVSGQTPDGGGNRGSAGRTHAVLDEATGLPEDPTQLPPDDIDEGIDPPSDAATAAEIEAHYATASPATPAGAAHASQPGNGPADGPGEEPRTAAFVDGVSDQPVDQLLGEPEEQPVDQYDPDLPLAHHWQALLRRSADPVGPDDVAVERYLRSEIAWHEAGLTREQVAAVNELAAAFYQNRFAGSWAQQHLSQRLGTDITGDPRFRPGHAPAGWTTLVEHLRRHGINDHAMLTAGVATTARTGRLIDRFRDRLVLPISTADGTVLGFVGRRHPDLSDTDNAGPKYLNTADTVLFGKGAQLYVAGHEHTAAGAVPVRVEGPLDAIAVTLATGGAHVGAAPLGTSLTDEQAVELAAMARAAGGQLIVATDPDLAGVMAAERDFWVLAQQQLDPGHARLPVGLDPADVLTARGPRALADLLAAAAEHPLARTLIDERLTNLPPDQALAAAGQVTAARPPGAWDSDATTISGRLWTGRASAAASILTAARTWTADPRRTSQQRLQDLSGVRQRIAAAANTEPEVRWRQVAARVDARLPDQPDWPALAHTLQALHDDGHSVDEVLTDATSGRPLNHEPAQDLRYRLLSVISTSPPPSAHDNARIDARNATSPSQADRLAAANEQQQRAEFNHRDTAHRRRDR